MLLGSFFHTSLTLILLFVSFVFIYVSIGKRTTRIKRSLGIIYILCSIPLLYVVIASPIPSPGSFAIGRVFVFTWILSIFLLFAAMFMTVVSIVTNWQKKQ
ncbi:hypothetical protein [Peribacillus deserti]|uniref:Uncharacterized protein n=1 Tax=Peribacillus deserti TaxID=673318 RepID=A0A2N5M5H7_9BACI|nr:hypothetical protein [Peribacillus deserti]PLT29595.1 hypothetical protein CUU66_11845 [Peribacillus deserti]